VLIAYSAFSVAPVIVTIFASLKSEHSFFSSPYSFPTQLFFSNYSQAWASGGLLVAFRNSLIVTGVAVVVSSGAASLAAYAVVRLRPRFAGFVQALFIAGFLVPEVVILVPLFIFVDKLGLSGTIGSIILPYCAMLIPLAFLVFVSFFRTVPVEIAEASYIDGCSRLRSFLLIELPLLKPAIATVAILNGVFVWNDLLLPLALGTNSSITLLPVAIINFFGVYATSYGLIFAAVVLASAPVILLYVALNRLFVEGITLGAFR
jgi:raffinose/stachyose/melibiose transport system permease protein